MSPEQRKARSEARIRALGLEVNDHLPLIESDDEVALRTAEEVLRRLVALWATLGAVFVPENSFFREYMSEGERETWLSDRERRFLLGTDRDEREALQLGWKLECLYFLSWSAGLIPAIDIPRAESSVSEIMHLFPTDLAHPSALESSIQLRPKEEVLDWSDLLYRLHWSVRDARLRKGAEVRQVCAGAVQEWHLAVNWLTRYEDEDNWDHVGTDT
jgi:hypothetical protein